MPLSASLPLQAPEALQEVALLADQLSVVLPPLATMLGLALMVTDGAAAATVMVADWEAEPPAPVHDSTYFVLALSAPVDRDPLVATDPLQAPEAVQAVALVEDQIRVALSPLSTVLGLVVNVTVGVGEVTDTVADCTALPPAPLQVSV